MKPAKRTPGAALRSADTADYLPLPRHGSYSRADGADAYRLHYCDWGRADNPQVVVCMHGYHRSARDFDILARDLSAQFRVICPDLAGRGNGDWLGTAAEHDFPQLLADLDELLFGLEIEEVDWIGASLGAILGMHLAVQPGTSIRRLVMKNIGEGVPLEASRQPGTPLSAPLAGVHSVDLWKRIKCPTVLLRSDTPAVSQCEASTIRRFLMQDVKAPREESHACVAA